MGAVYAGPGGRQPVQALTMSPTTAKTITPKARSFVRRSEADDPLSWRARGRLAWGKRARREEVLDTTSLTHQLLRKREHQGLLLVVWVRVGFFTLFLTVNLFIQQNTFALVTGTILMGISLLMCGWFLYLLNHKCGYTFIGRAGAVMDSILFSVLHLSWYLSVGGDEVSAAFLIKADIIPLIFALIALNTLTLRSSNVIIITSYSVGYLLSILLYAIQDERVIEASSYVMVHLGNEVSVDGYFAQVLLVAVGGTILAIVTFLGRTAVVEAVERERTESRISRFFSPGVVREIAESEEDFMRPGGNEREVAVLFSDIRGFTALSEKMMPSNVMKMLSEYHEGMVRCIFDNGGTLDKFIGDGIMADFGTPDPDPGAATKAVRAGVAMRRALDDLNEKRKQRGEDPIRTGIGIHFGPVIAGNLGTEERLEYTVIGDTVNLASRVESSCKIVGRDFLVTQAVVDAADQDALEADGIRFEKLTEDVRVKGKHGPLVLYAVNVG